MAETLSTTVLLRDSEQLGSRPKANPNIKSKILEAIKKEMETPTAVKHNRVTFDKSEEE
jgi:hypothetical protein